MDAVNEIMRPGKIGPMEVGNRILRAPTSETMATADGKVTPKLVEFYERLAKGGAGLITTGHIYVERRGQYAPFQTGLDTDEKVEGWQDLVAAVHRQGGKIFAELSHAGSQSVVPGNTPVAPSIVPNAIFSTRPHELSEAETKEVIAAFGRAAARAMAAGFDGIHIHGGNGYLISQFLSPLTNQRTDDWGGKPEARARFLTEIYTVVRGEAGPDRPVTARIGMADVSPDGLALDDSLSVVRRLRELGLDAVEPTYCIMNSYLDNIRPYVGVSAGRALRDWAIERIWRPQIPEAYYRQFAKAIKQACGGMPVILVGGVRSTGMMNDLIGSGDVDFVALARPFIREPDLPRQIRDGRTGSVDCVSCNMCLMHEGKHSLRCWRKNKTDLFRHLWLHHVAGRT